jgi:hypothetical protein
MALYLVTGQPGHGKTAYGLDKAFQFQKEGRDVYIHGVKDFDYAKAGMKYLDDPTKWQDLPDGAVVVLDECYTVFPNRNPGAKVPDHVEAMARHRHRGFDFILIAQQGLQLDPFLRGLYEEHCHVRQTSIMKSKTKLKRWNQYQSNVQGACNDVLDWVRPKYVFDYYTSTTLVTTRRRMPMWAVWLTCGVAFIVILILGIKWYFAAKIARYQAEQGITADANWGPTAARGTKAAGGPPARQFDTPTDYARAHLPRFASMPETAPIFDDRAPLSQPALFCMSGGEGDDGAGDHKEPSCTCLTEQGTKYDLSQPECRTLARFGPAYNPYKAPKADQYQQPPVASVSAPASPGASSSPGTVVGYTSGQRADVFPANPAKTISGYTPPTTTL